MPLLQTILDSARSQDIIQLTAALKESKQSGGPQDINFEVPIEKYSCFTTCPIRILAESVEVPAVNWLIENFDASKEQAAIGYAVAGRFDLVNELLKKSSFNEFDKKMIAINSHKWLEPNSILRILTLTPDTELRSALAYEYLMAQTNANGPGLRSHFLNKGHKALQKSEGMALLMSKHQLSFEEANLYVKSNNLRAFFLAATGLVNQKGVICADVFFKIGTFLFDSYTQELKCESAENVFKATHYRILERLTKNPSHMGFWSTPEAKNTEKRLSLRQAELN